jgi:hypothetical protein
MKLDFHVHTKYSIDSIIEPKALAARCKKLGIIPAITDHNNIDSHRVFHEMKAEFIPGEEIRTDRGDLIGLFLNEGIARKTPFEEAIDKIHSQGGLAYLPHMYDRTRHGAIPSKPETSKLDIIETFNARCPVEEYNRKAQNFATQNSKPGAVGSDSHFLFEFGKTYNEMPEFDLESPRKLLKILKTQNPMLKTQKAPLFVRGTTTFVAMGRKLMRVSGLNKFI